MSKSIGKFLGAGNASTNTYGSEQEILKYLNNYDTSQADAANKNMATLANQLSSNLSTRPNYVYSVNGSDVAAQRAENAAYQNALGKITPQFDAMRRQLETRLQNQGIGVGSEAYNSAMNSLDSAQSNAYTQAAYDSIAAGQNAFTNSLNNQIAAGNFQNSARMLPISEIQNLLQNSKSGYDVAMDKFNIANNRDIRVDTNKAANTASQNAAGWNAMLGLGSIFSDEDLKENIIEVGRLYNGLPIYLYTYKGDNIPHIGLLAQQVACVKPEAVFLDENGYMKVNYALACC